MLQLWKLWRTSFVSNYRSPMQLRGVCHRAYGVFVACAACQINLAFLIILARQGRGELRSILLILVITAHGSSIRLALFALNN